MREDLRSLTKDYDKSENDLKALQSVGQVHRRYSLLHQSVRQLSLDCWRSFETTNGR